METMSIYTVAKNYDPTHTTALRNAFANAMKLRFVELCKVVRISVDTNDCFSLRPKHLAAFQMNPIPPEYFRFARSTEKITAFMDWLQQQINAGILQVGFGQQLGSGAEGAWTNLYVLDSYKRGVQRARNELEKIGIKVPTINESGGFNVLFDAPFHMDRIGLIYTRVYAELQGITAQMDTIISRILAQGLIDGDAPAFLAQKLVAAINGAGIGDLALTDKLGRFIPAMTRAMIMARTEVIRAHHLAMIQEYRNWGVEGVVVKGEWMTAGDDRVCPKCAELEGQVFTLDVIESMIPYHPQCRCIALPYIEQVKK